MRPNSRTLQPVGSNWCPRGSGRVPHWVHGAPQQAKVWGEDSQQPSEYLYLHFTDKESKAQKGLATVPRSPNKEAAKPELEPKQASSPRV